MEVSFVKTRQVDSRNDDAKLMEPSDENGADLCARTGDAAPPKAVTWSVEMSHDGDIGRANGEARIGLLPLAFARHRALTRLQC